MISINSHDFQNALFLLLRRLVNEGNDVVVRGQNTQELLSCHISVADTTRLCYFMPFRKDNIFARIAETLWVLQGRNDIGWLSFYLPRAPEFSDNGMTWRAAYGNRLRHWDWAYEDTDQISIALNKLIDDPTTRQAVMTIWDPAIDNRISKDIPCNNWLHFIKRRYGDTDYLFLDIAQRSADVFWGWSNINVFEWSILLKMMAYWTGCAPGSIDWLVTSMHMYEHHYKTAEKILEYNAGTGVIWEPLKFSVPFDMLTGTLQRIMQNEAIMRGTAPDVFPRLMLVGDGLLDTFSHMLSIYVKFKQGATNEFLSDMIAGMQESEFKYAALLHIARERPDILDEYIEVYRGVTHTDEYDLVRSIVSIEND